MLALVGIVFVFAQVVSRSAGAAPAACPCQVTIDAHDFTSGNQLENFSFIVNLDNSKKPTDKLALDSESNSPVLAEGNQSNKQVTLPAGRYLVSVRATSHKMWGAYFTLPDDAGTVRVDLTQSSDEHPLPLGKIRVFVFNDSAWTNGAPDTEEAGLGGFQIGLEEQTGSAVTVDYFNNPLCGGVCTSSDAPATLGFAEIDNLGPASYFIDVHPPAGPCNSDPNSQWYQTTTIDGGLNLWAPTEEGADGTGAPGEQLWEPPNIRTAYWFGFVCGPRPFGTGGSGEITGTARNWVEWAPYTVGTFNDPVEFPLVALSDASTDQTVYVGRGDGAGNFDIQGVPAGDYNIAIWDEQLSYIMRFKPVHVVAGQTSDLNDTGDDLSVGVGVSRWFGWLDGTVYKDLDGDGKLSAGDAPIPNTDVDQRWRDGSIKEGTFTDAGGRYEYPTAEGGALGRWIINEQGFGRFSADPGASVHDERSGAVTPSCLVDGTPVDPCIPNSLGGGLLMNQLLLEGHRTTVDWGKHDYPDGTPGQIVGITYFATTRNEFDARFQAHEDYEPGIPDVTVLLETPGPDGEPNTADDVVVNEYVTDHWYQPSLEPSADDKQSCGSFPLDFAGNPLTDLSPNISPNCLEVPLTGEQTKEGAFDGGYAFADYCPGGYDRNAHGCVGGSDPVPLEAGDYVVHAVMPKDESATDMGPCNPAGQSQRVTTAKGTVPGGGEHCLYHIVREEDVNVDLGNAFAPQIPPPPCNGDSHVVDQSTLVTRNPHFGDSSYSAPLCDKHLVVLQNQQNANADFFLMTNFNTDPNGANANDARIGDVEVPGRIVGQVFNDIYFERNKLSPWYGEPRPIGNIPIGVYARVDSCRDFNDANNRCPGGYSMTGHEVGRDGPDAPEVTYDSSKWRLIKTIKTSADGSYEILLPSTETFNCPIPQGPCPGMYLLTVNDPGFIDGTQKGGPGDHSNSGYNPNILTATSVADVWPGLTTQMDTPLDPISGTACEDPAGGTTPDPSDPAIPELLEVSRPYVQATDSGSAREITIKSDFISSPNNATGSVLLTDWRTGDVATLTSGNGGVQSWTRGSGTADTIVVRVPALSSSFTPGPKQLTIVTANSNGGVSSVNGITVHVLGTGGGITYNPKVVDVGAPTPNGHQLQNAIDDPANPAGSLLVLRAGTYNENVLLWRPMKVQGLGPGGIVGAHELQGRDAEDPRFNVQGTVIDGRFYDAGDFKTEVNAHDPYYLPNFSNGSSSSVLGGADITVVAKTTSSYDLTGSGSQRIFSQARIDGLALATGQGEGAGGIQLQAAINNLQITNNVLENNSGVVAGGIALGQPFVASHNHDVRIDRNRLIGNGALTQAGGIGIFNGSNNYEVVNSVLCSNFSVNYGAGIGHIGSSPKGTIKDNRIYYNEAVDSGGGITIAGELPIGGGLGDGSGDVDIDRNLIQSNASVLDDGGGLFVLNALNSPIRVRNNMIVDNLAADLGAILLDDSSKVSLINNTIADNVTTASSENSAIGVPHAAGLVSEANEPAWQTDPDYASQYPNAATRPYFSDPIALFNNIFWNNDAMTLDQLGPGAALVDQGFIDFEIFGTCAVHATCANDTFTPRFSDLTNGQILGPDGVQRSVPGGQSNLGADPGFVTPFVLELAVGGSRLDPQQAAVSITGADPPVGLTGDYHIANNSPAVDRGAGFVPLPSGPTQTPTSASILAPCSTEAVTTLSSGVNTSATTISVASKTGFPITYPFYIQIERNNGNGETEVLRVDGSPNATTWSVTRGSSLGNSAPFGGTTSRAHSSGALVRLMSPFYPADFDREFRPQLRVNNRARTAWDIGADERPGTVEPPWLTIPGHYSFGGGAGGNVTFDWNGPGQPQCAASTVPVTP